MSSLPKIAVGFCPVGFCPVGFCPSGVLSQWGFVRSPQNFAGSLLLTILTRTLLFRVDVLCSMFLHFAYSVDNKINLSYCGLFDVSRII